MIEKLKQLGLKNDLILFDRGYPSKDFFAYLEGSKIKYLMRMKTKPMKEVNDAKEIENFTGDTALAIEQDFYASDIGYDPSNVRQKVHKRFLPTVR